MRSFRLILLTIWISTSTANPYPQNDSIGQGSNSNSLTTESDSASSDQLGLYNTDEDNNTLESCRIDGTTKATKVRRQSCSNTAVQAPPKPKIKVPEPEPETTVKKEQPNSEPKLDLGSVIPPSQRPPKKYAYQGPCPWPFKQFLCCLESLMVPGQNLLGCWHYNPLDPTCVDDKGITIQRNFFCCDYLNIVDSIGISCTTAGHYP